MPKRKRAEVSESESINNELQNIKLVKNDKTENSIIAKETPDKPDQLSTVKTVESSTEEPTHSTEENTTETSFEGKPEQTDKENITPAPSSKSKSTPKMLRLLSWNINGARAVVKKPESLKFFQKTAKNPEVQAFGLQETKCDGSTFPKELDGKKLGFQNHFLNSSASKKGYSGTCVYRVVENT